MTFQRLLQGERVVAAAWLTATAIAYSDTGVAFPLWMALFVYALAIAGWWLLRMVAGWIADPPRRESWSSRLFVPAVLAIGVFIALTPVVLIARLRASERALVSGGSRPEVLSTAQLQNTGERIGWFTVTDFERYGDEMRFFTSPCGLVDRCGLVYSPAGKPARRGKDSFRHLYGPWWHLYQSF